MYINLSCISREFQKNAGEIKRNETRLQFHPC